MRRAAIAVLCAALIAATEAGAADQGKPASPPAAAAPSTPPTPTERPPPYEPQLLRLAELTGALAYLRDVCGARDGDQFRARMAKLLEAEGISDTRRDLLAGAYNRGFRDYQTSYRVCTPVADQVIARLLSETAKLASELASRFGS